MFVQIETHKVNHAGGTRVCTVHQNTETGEFFVRTEYEGYENTRISLATVYKAVRKFTSLTAVREYLA